MKYIEADRLKAEIERLYDIARDASYNGEIEGEMTAYDKILSLIDSLQQEQPEVELDDVIENYILENFGERWDGAVPVGCLELDLMAEHFYKLGKNTRTGE